ncbi:IucA/IucC family protein [Nocardia gipuzkoensis]|uniref:IucA/IucC family protein n=1 Tax=Nocardia gipuzkoensis TaxID=2749991 RepID=UPI001C664BFB|nr:IucA/IucC family protein [Nocardia gipuzkoensis]
MLREDVVGLRTRSTTVLRPDGRWLRLAATTGADALLLPVAPDGFLCRYTVRLPLLARESDGVELRTIATIVAALADFAEDADRAGFDAFVVECQQALAAIRLHQRTRGRTMARLIASYGDRLDAWCGPASLAFDTLAARHDHPVYPAARARAGLDDAQLRSYAPEFHPRFALRWLAIPRRHVTVAGGADFPRYWPTPDRVGLSELAGSHLLLPLHPLTVGAPLERALGELGLSDDCVLSEQAYLEVIPTLSMRTVALADDPAEHLKLPLATATLGQRNVRTIKQRTLVDGALGQRLLATVRAREPRLRDTILLADENIYAHAGHELLAVLCRRYPAVPARSVVVPMAALLSRAHDGRRVLDHLADEFYEADPVGMFDAWLTVLFDWQTTLFGYGIALESHQQNVSLVLDRVDSGATRLRLLFKDNDTPRVHTARIRARLGTEPATFADPRINVADDRALTDLFTTITVHLCAGAYAFEMAQLGYAPRSRLLRLVRHRLGEAIGRLDQACADRLCADVLDAPRLPVKAMVSAGTLFTKQRSGATDINKHYTSGPNYLLTLGGLR